jgi:catechol 2,3-dioxygenase-like lactoylglutathione lyase family enzyme
MMLHYAAVKVSDLERSGAFYDAILAPLGWRRQVAPANAVSWGLIKPEFFISQNDSQRPGYGLISFPAKSIPAVKASFESGSASGGEPVAEPGSAPLFGPGNYACRLNDPDGYLVELCVAHER